MTKGARQTKRLRDDTRTCLPARPAGRSLDASVAAKRSGRSLLPVERAGRAARQQGLHGGDPPPLADRHLRAGQHLAIPSPQSGRGDAFVGGQAGGCRRGRASIAACRGFQRSPAQGEALEGDQTPLGRIEAPAWRDEAIAEKGFLILLVVRGGLECGGLSGMGGHRRGLIACGDLRGFDFVWLGICFAWAKRGRSNFVLHPPGAFRPPSAGLEVRGFEPLAFSLRTRRSTN